MALHIDVDRDRCQGAGLCVFHAPATFDQDDIAFKVVLLETRDADDAVRQAAEACPQRAITVTEI